MKTLQQLTCLVTAGLLYATCPASSQGAVIITAEVVSSNPTSHTVRFGFSGDFSDVGVPQALDNFLFIDLTDSSAIADSVPSNGNFTDFEENSVTRNDGGLLELVETRIDDGSVNFDRIGFSFDSVFANAVAFEEGSFLELVIPTSSTFTSGDFEGLPIYWGLSFSNPNGVGPLAGTVVAIPEPASLGLLGLGALALLRRRARAQA